MPSAKFFLLLWDETEIDIASFSRGFSPERKILARESRLVGLPWYFSGQDLLRDDEGGMGCGLHQ